MAEAALLTLEDLALLKDFVGKVKRAYVSKVSTSAQQEPWEPGYEGGQDTYIALPVESGGIAGLTVVGPASVDEAGEVSTAKYLNVPGNGDVPGVALCDIYRISGDDDELEDYSELELVEESVKVYNLSQERLGKDWITVTRSAEGHYLANPITNVVMGILLTNLDKCSSPLTGAKFARLKIIEYKSQNQTFEDNLPRDISDISEYLPNTWQVTNRIITVVNRFVSHSGVPGVLGKFKKTYGEWIPDILDCAPSEEGVQIVVEYEEALVSGGYGSGSYGDGTYGG